MGLDIYVMSLWQFKAGDFRSPIEAATGIRPKIATADGIEERPVSVGWLDRWRARRQVVAIRKAVEAVNRTRVRWDDEGGVVYSRQSGGREALRAYARCLDCEARMRPRSNQPPEGEYHKHPAWNWRSNGRHALTWWSTTVTTAITFRATSRDWPKSSVHDLRALARLAIGRLERAVAAGTGSRAGAIASPERYEYPQDDPLVAVKAAYLQLREVAELSCRHGLPIIFWG